MAGFDRRLVSRFDWTLFALTLSIAGVGLICVLSASYAGPGHVIDPLVYRQLIWVAAGAAILMAAAVFDYRSLATYAYPFYAMTVVLLGVVEVSGHSTGGSRRWINLGFFKLEPSELAKIALALVLVRYLREEPPRGGWGIRQMIIPALLLAVPVGLVLKQPDLGTALILMLLFATMIFVGGLNWRVLVAVAMLTAMAAPLGWHYLKPYQKQRMVSFINPQSDPLGSGYHIIQSEIAIGSGGSYGKGFLKGTQARLNFLPEQTTDFIFSVFAEEFGFAGSVLLMALYAGLVGRGIWIARHARDRFGALLAVGLSAIVFWQVAINVGMASGVLPVVGIPLPMVSYGGSSLIIMMAAMGILISVNTRRYMF